MWTAVQSLQMQDSIPSSKWLLATAFEQFTTSFLSVISNVPKGMMENEDTGSGTPDLSAGRVVDLNVSDEVFSNALELFLI
jgi:hypothetical protein